MPKVSVIIPTYNRSSLVKEAVNSVLGQSFKNFEILVVDDSSVWIIYQKEQIHR